MQLLPQKIPTPFSSQRCRCCGATGGLVKCSAPGCSDYHSHIKCHQINGGFLVWCVNSGVLICLCAVHKLRVDRLYTDNHILYNWCRKLGGLQCVFNDTVMNSIKDSGPDMRGTRIEVFVKVTEGGREWFTGQVKRQRYKQVFVHWENGDDPEWIDLKHEQFRFVK